MKIKLSLNSELDIFQAKQHIEYSVKVYHKNGKLLTTHNFYNSYTIDTIDEVYAYMKRKFPNKVLELEIELRD
jgi:hypothetical protein